MLFLLGSDYYFRPGSRTDFLATIGMHIVIDIRVSVVRRSSLPIGLWHSGLFVSLARREGSGRRHGMREGVFMVQCGGSTVHITNGDGLLADRRKQLTIEGDGCFVSFGTAAQQWRGQRQSIILPLAEATLICPRLG